VTSPRRQCRGTGLLYHYFRSKRKCFEDHLREGVALLAVDTDRSSTRDVQLGASSCAAFARISLGSWLMTART